MQTHISQKSGATIQIYSITLNEKCNFEFTYFANILLLHIFMQL